MTKLFITKKIFSQKTSNYTFAILFFLIFSAFIIFAIKPSLTVVASLKKEELDLKRIDSVYEEIVTQMVKTQTFMEENRDRLPLLREALPDRPSVNKIIDDIKNVSSDSSLIVKKTTVSEVNLKSDNKKDLNKLHLALEANASFENTLKFIQELFKQRRLKTIQEIKINGEKKASPDGQLKIEMQIDGYYL